MKWYEGTLPRIISEMHLALSICPITFNDQSSFHVLFQPYNNAVESKRLTDILRFRDSKGLLQITQEISRGHGIKLLASEVYVLNLFAVSLTLHQL